MILDYRHPEALFRALEALQKEQAFVYPTDTLYGFGADAASETGIHNVEELKKRPAQTPFSLLVRDLAMMKEYARVSSLTAALTERFLPGALTLVLPGIGGRLPDMLYSDGNYLGFRIPDHPFCRELMASYPRPVLSTSVNISGQKALNRIRDIEMQYAPRVELMIADADLDRRPYSAGSTVIRIDDAGRISLLREGSIPFADILKV